MSLGNDTPDYMNRQRMTPELSVLAADLKTLVDLIETRRDTKSADRRLDLTDKIERLWRDVRKHTLSPVVCGALVAELVAWRLFATADTAANALRFVTHTDRVLRDREQTRWG